MESNSFLGGLANLIVLSVFLGAIWIVGMIFTALGAAEAFLPCLVSVNSMAPNVQAGIQAPQAMHIFSFTPQTEPEATTVSLERSVKALPAAP